MFRSVQAIWTTLVHIISVRTVLWSFLVGYLSE